MKKKHSFLISNLFLTLIFLGFQFSGIAQAYNFESDTNGNPPADISATNGTISTDDDTSPGGRGKTMTTLTASSGTRAAFNMDLFPSTKNYSVTWKETYTTAGNSGFTLRAFGSNTVATGIQRGYLFLTKPVNGKANIYISKSSGFTLISAIDITAPGVDIPRWYRASVEESTLTFEYSDDGIAFTQIESITDTTYPNAGGTQYTRGYGAAITGSFTDDISYHQIISQTPLSINNISEYQVFQRNSSNQANILISGTYTGEPTAIEASFNQSPYVTIDSNPSNGTFSGTLPMVNSGQGTITIRYTNETGTTATVDNVGIGDVFVIAGQSNGSGRGNTLNSYTHATLKASLFGNDDVWKNLTDATDSNSGQVDPVSSDGSASGSAWPIVATSILANTGVPVAFVPTTKGGSSISQWQPEADHTDASTLYGSMNRRINAVGGVVAGVLFFQGESDANQGTAQGTYETKLSTLINTIATDFPGTKTMIGQIGKNSYPGTNSIRAAQISTINSNANALLGPTMYDIDLADEGGDNLHFKSDNDMAQFASRWYAAIDKRFYEGIDGYGPILDAINLTYDDGNNKVTIPFSDDSNPILDIASTVTANSFNLKNNGVSVAISEVSIVGNKIEITPTVSLNTAQTITLTYASLNTAVDAAIYDSNSLPAQPFYDETVNLENTLATENLKNNDFNIYPNPAKGIVYLKSDKNVNIELNITIYNTLGKKVLEMNKKAKNGVPINISSLNKGLYFLKVKTGFHESIKKIVIE